jgi:hypothetical protein
MIQFGHTALKPVHTTSVSFSLKGGDFLVETRHILRVKYSEKDLTIVYTFLFFDFVAFIVAG